MDRKHPAGRVGRRGRRSISSDPHEAAGPHSNHRQEILYPQHISHGFQPSMSAQAFPAAVAASQDRKYPHHHQNRHQHYQNQYMDQGGHRRGACTISQPAVPRGTAVSAVPCGESVADRYPYQVSSGDRAQSNNPYESSSGSPAERYGVDEFAEEFSPSSCDNAFDDGSNTQFVLVGLCKILSDVCADNDQKPLPSHANDRFIKFCSSVIPPISIVDYVKRIAKYGELDCACFIMALMHVDRLINRHSLVLTTSTIHRLFLTCCVVSAKFHQDSFYTNAVYAKVGGICNKEMNELELDLLFLLNFDIAFSREEYDVYFRQLLLHGHGATAASSLASSPAVSIPRIPSVLDSPTSTASSVSASSDLVADTALRPAKHCYGARQHAFAAGPPSARSQAPYRPARQQAVSHHHQQSVAPSLFKQPENVQSISNGTMPAGSPSASTFQTKAVSGAVGFTDIPMHGYMNFGYDGHRMQMESDADCGMHMSDRSRKKSVEMQTYPLGGASGALMMMGMHPNSAFSNAVGAVDAPVTVLPLHVGNGAPRTDLLAAYGIPEPYHHMYPLVGYHLAAPSSSSPPVH